MGHRGFVRLIYRLSCALFLLSTQYDTLFSQWQAGEYTSDVNTVLLLHMNETSGTIVADASSYGNNGTAVGTTIVNGKFGRARYFGGGYINVGAPSSLKITGNQISIEAWVYVLGDGSNWGRIVVGGAVNSVYTLTKGNGSDDRILWIPTIAGQGSGYPTLLSKSRVRRNAWNHIAAVYDGSSSKIYINGALDTMLTGLNGNLATDANNISVGGEPGSVFDGYIDEVRISSKARSPQEFNLQLPPTNLSATATGSAVSLSWQNGGGAVGLLQYKIYRGNDSTNIALIDSTTSTSYTDSGLAAGTKYFYRLSAVDSTGFEGAKSYALNITTLSPPVVPVLVSPLNNATGVATTITLSWSASTGAITYRVQVSTSSSFTTTVVDDSTVTGTTRQIGPLSNNTTYYWRVSASNAGGTSAFSTPWSFTAIVASPAAPTLASPGDGATNQAINVTLNWNGATGATSYRLQVSTDQNFGTMVYDQSNLTSTSQAMTGLLNNTTYYWRVSASNAGGTSGWSTGWSFTTLPQRLLGEYDADGNTVLLLHMNETSGATVSDASSYSYNGTAMGATIVDGKFGKARNFNGTSDWIDLGNTQVAGNSSELTLECWARSTGLVSVGAALVERSNDQFAGGATRIFRLEITPTGAVGFGINNIPPSNGLGVISSSGVFAFDNAWQHIAATYSSSNGIKIYRNGVKVADTSLTIGSISSLLIRTSIGNKFNSVPSQWFKGELDEVRISTVARNPSSFNLQLPPTNLSATATGSAVSLSWQNGGGAVGLLQYKIYRGNDSTNIALIDSTTSTSYTDSGLAAGTKYFYRLSAVDSTGFEGAKSYALNITTLSPPVVPVLVSPLNNATGVATTITLSWSASTGAITYRVQVSTSSSFTTTVVDDSTVTGTTRQIGPLSNNTTYYWRVSATNAGGTSGWSTGWSFTTLPQRLLGEYTSDVNTVLLLQMNETSGSTVSDASSYGNNGTATGTSIVGGRFGNARSLNGSVDYVEGSSSNMNFAGQNYTLEAWIKTSSIAGQAIFTTHNPSAGKYSNTGLYIAGGTSGGFFDMDINNGQGTSTSNFNGTKVNDGCWHHVAGVRNGNIITLYVDGRVDFQKSVTQEPSSSTIYRVGQSYPGSYFNGVIDEIRISSKARSPQEFNLQLPPTNLSATATGSAVSLGWQNGGGAVGLLRYKIYRGNDSTNVTLVDSTTSTSYANSGLVLGTKYFYRISAVDVTGFEGAKSYAAAVTPSGITLSLPSTTAVVGSAVSIPIAVTEFNHIGSLSLSITFDKAVLTYTGLAGAPAGTNATSAATANANGSVTIGWFSTSPLSIGTGNLLNLLFTFWGDSCALTFTNTIASSITDSLGNNLPAAYTNGKISRSIAVSVTGTITYGTGSSPVSGATVTLTAQGGTATTAQTSSTGAYSFTSVNPGVYTLSVTKTGGHPTVYTNAADALKAALYSVDPVIYQLTAIQKLAADVNNDGNVNSADALQIILRYVGTLTSFAKGDWVFVPAQTTINAGASNVTDNVQAIAVGDVNVDAVPSSGTFFAKGNGGTQSVVPATGATLRINSVDMFEVPVRVEAATSLGSMSLAFQYPADAATFVGVRGPEGMVSAANNGVIKIAWFNADHALSLKDNDTVVTLRFKPTSNIKNFSLTLDPTSQITDDRAIVLTGVRIEIPTIDASVPRALALGQNYPNPFNPSTMIQYDLTVAGHVALAVYNMLGQVVAKLVDETQNAGTYKVTWDGSGAASGIYFYRLQAGDASTGSARGFLETKKMILLH